MKVAADLDLRNGTAAVRAGLAGGVAARAPATTSPCVDSRVSRLPREAVDAAELIAFYLPMHTATRLFLRLMERVRAPNPMRTSVLLRTVCAAERRDFCGAAGVRTDPRAASSSRRWWTWRDGAERGRAPISLDTAAVSRPRSRAASRRWARTRSLLTNGGRQARRLHGSQSRGCKHLCRHCPVVPVYNGAFRIVQQDVVLADIRQQVAAGRGAHHLRRSRFLQWPGPRHADRGSAASRSVRR